MYLFQKIENRFELYSFEQGSQTVDIKNFCLEGARSTQSTRTCLIVKGALQGIH